MAIEHKEFLEELFQLLTDEDSEDKSPEEIMSEVVAIVDDYKSEIKLNKSEQDERNNLTMMGFKTEDDNEEIDYSESVEEPIVNPINRAFLLTKAQKDYNKKLGLTEEDIDNFSPSEKIKHRKGVTELFNQMIIEEKNKEKSPSKYAAGPFKKTPGSISVNRKIEEDEDDDEIIEEATPAEKKWKLQQSKQLKADIKSVTVEIDELKRQNKIPKISPSIVNRNMERIADLEDELENLEQQRQQYK